MYVMQSYQRAHGEEMVSTMTKHVIANHPDVATEIEEMHSEDPKRWGRETKPNWESAPEA